MKILSIIFTVILIVNIYIVFTQDSDLGYNIFWIIFFSTALLGIFFYKRRVKKKKETNIFE